MTKKNDTIIAPADAVEAVETKTMGRFAQLEAEALADYTPAEPYVIDDVVPPIVITEPVESDRVVGMAILYAKGGEAISPREFHPLLRAICGDAYERVWDELLAKRHLQVAYKFISDVQKHFSPRGSSAGTGGAGEVPGGSQA